MAIVPKEYQGREQAFVKHTILRTYLQRLLMIVGRAEPIINYVDCFSGPWSEESSELEDTSIGISLQQMKQAAESLSEQFGRQVDFRALYIEKDKSSYGKLSSFLVDKDHSPIKVSCMHGDYTARVDDIIKWTGGAFTFFFVDPKGWKRIINAPTLEPLLKLKKVEFLINLMYDFFNRAVSIEDHADDVEELLGRSIVLRGIETSEERQQLIVSSYREAINKIYCGRTTHVPVERPGADRILYFLVYLTRHPLGIMVFKEAAEKMLLVQRVTQLETRLRRQMENSSTRDLFALDEDSSSFSDVKVEDNRLSAKEYLMQRLSSTPLLIDYECWATFLEETDLYPSDFQLAFKVLIDEGIVANLDASVHRRTKKPVKPSWPNRSERWVLMV